MAGMIGNLSWCLNMSNLVVVEKEGELVIDSRLVAQELGMEHNLLMETINRYKHFLSWELGRFRGDTQKLSGSGRGSPPNFYFFNEKQATFIITMLSENPEPCLINLLKVFSKAKETLISKGEDGN